MYASGNEHVHFAHHKAQQPDGVVPEPRDVRALCHQASVLTIGGDVGGAEIEGSFEGGVFYYEIECAEEIVDVYPCEGLLCGAEGSAEAETEGACHNGVYAAVFRENGRKAGNDEAYAGGYPAGFLFPCVTDFGEEGGYGAEAVLVAFVPAVVAVHSGYGDEEGGFIVYGVYVFDEGAGVFYAAGEYEFFMPLCPTFVYGCSGEIDDDIGGFELLVELFAVSGQEFFPAYRNYFVSFCGKVLGKCGAYESALSCDCYFHAFNFYFLSEGCPEGTALNGIFSRHCLTNNGCRSLRTGLPGCLSIPYRIAGVILIYRSLAINTMLLHHAGKLDFCVGLAVYFNL